MRAMALTLLGLVLPVTAKVIELLERPTYFATRGMCDAYENWPTVGNPGPLENGTVSMAIPVLHTLPVSDDWSIGLVRGIVEPCLRRHATPSGGQV